MSGTASCYALGMKRLFSGFPAVWRALAALFLLCSGWAPGTAQAQTPSPLQEWQYPGGISLYNVFEPTIPKWRVVLGGAAESVPMYNGASVYRVTGGPVIDVRYYDLAFASVGEGLGVNILHGTKYRAGVAIGYDLGRHVSDDPANLHGLGDIKPAPVVKVFGSYVISKAFPLVLRADVRQFIGGGDGVVGDVEAFLPLPGSSEKFFMLAGPSVTFADRLYMQKEFGVSAIQARDSGYEPFAAHGGGNAAGLGFSGTWLITPSWLFNVNGAADRLLGSARESPITETNVQLALALSIARRW